MSQQAQRRRKDRRNRPRLRDRVVRQQRTPSAQLMYILSRFTLLIVVLMMATVGAPRLARSILAISSTSADQAPSELGPALVEARRAVLRATAEGEREALRRVAEQELQAP